jgi:hypothetical protein
MEAVAVTSSKAHGMMASFTASLLIEEVGYEKWSVEKEFSFESDTGLVVTVQKGFICDLASVPALAQCIVSKLGYWTQPAVVHDMLYYRHRNRMDSNVTRLQADRILLEGCKLKAHEYHVPDLERRDWIIFGGVIAGGLETWETPEEKKHRVENLRGYDITGD